MKNPEDILLETIHIGEHKIQKSLVAKIFLGFIGGAMISLGYLLYIRVVAAGLEKLGALSSFIGACVFPIGLIVILLAGGELITGNMMAVAAAFWAKKIKLVDLIKNWFIITISNIVGALFVAYIFGHFLGLTSTGVYRYEMIEVAHAKLAANGLQDFISGIGCNWFVGVALWLAYGAKDSSGKILSIWFPVMTFVAIGFQHSVANAFIIPAAIFEHEATWGQFLYNFVFVYLGNIVGGSVFVSLFYYLVYGKSLNIKV